MTDTHLPSAQDRNRALALATFAFAVCFAVWTLFSIIGLSIKQQLGLSDTQFGLLVATPVLTGSISRLFLGLWAERFGGRVVFPLQMLTTAIAVWLLTWAGSYPVFLLAALGLGLAGGSFIVGVSYVSRWYPAARQGTALGIYGVGNIGAAVTNLGAPFLVVALGWEDTARLYALVLAATALLFWLLARTDPRHAAHRAGGSDLPTITQQLAPLKNMQVWRFSAYYFFVFGGFVALASFLPRYYTGAWGLPLTTAGLLAGLYSLPGALFRALGGWMSDRWGARRVLYRVFALSIAALLVMGYPGGRLVLQGMSGPVTFEMAVPLPLFVTVSFVLGLGMSIGSAAVYKHVPAYYPDHVGAVGGLVGMIGGLGGFFLPIAFGLLLDATGIWTAPFLLMLAVVALVLLWMHRAVRRIARIAPAARAARGARGTARPIAPG